MRLWSGVELDLSRNGKTLSLHLGARINPELIDPYGGSRVSLSTGKVVPCHWLLELYLSTCQSISQTRRFAVLTQACVMQTTFRTGTQGAVNRVSRDLPARCGRRIFCGAACNVLTEINVANECVVAWRRKLETAVVAIHTGSRGI